MTTIVDYSTAKLLKEKEFDIPMEQNGRVYCECTGKIDSILSSNQISNWNDKCYIEICSAPTIAEVVMWIYEKHELWIHVMQSFREFTPYIQCDWNYRQDAITEVLEFMKKRFESPTEAYEASIKYTLENLI